MDLEFEELTHQNFSDAEVIEHIQKVEAKEEISQEEWKKLAYKNTFGVYWRL